MEYLNSRLIIERMKSVLRISNDKDLRDVFGVPQSTFANWKNRNAIPFEIVLRFSQEYQVKLDWLALGIEHNQLDTAQQMALTAFNALDDQKKIQAISFMSGLQKEASTDGMNIRTGDNSTNNQQVFHGEVKEVIGFNK